MHLHSTPHGTFFALRVHLSDRSIVDIGEVKIIEHGQTGRPDENPRNDLQEAYYDSCTTQPLLQTQIEVSEDGVAAASYE
jgi:hypothetical protein